MNADGSNAMNLTMNTTFDTEPSWSPDGMQIAFISAGLGSDIFVIDKDGMNRVNLTNLLGTDVNPDWSR